MRKSKAQETARTNNVESKNPGKRRSIRKDSITKIPSDVPVKPKTKVFVYVQLKSITNLPQEQGIIEVELTYGGQTIPRLDAGCCKDAVWDLRREDPTTTFSFPIVQDSIDDLNTVSDHPIIITLFNRMYFNADNMVEEEGEYRKVYAQGYIDLLGYFSKKRISAMVNTFIYPTDKADNINYGTVQATWHIYALLPLLKNIEFSNLIFINFESLYNVNEDLMDDPEDLMGLLAFRSMLPNQHGEFELNKICSFSGFTRSIIKEQNPYFIWEAAKSNENYTGQSFGLQSENKVNVYKLFKRVLRPEGVNVSFRDIIIEADEALTCNSLHRFVLTEELRALLEDVFVFRQQQLLVQLYRLGAPEDILLEGIIEPSVLLYPFVNAVRFAVALTPPLQRHRSTLDASKTNRKSRTKDNIGGGDSLSKPIFCIVSMCLLTPITETLSSLAKYTQSDQRERLKFCQRAQSMVIMAPFEVLKERAYDSFDEWIIDLVDHIVRHKIHDISDARNFFCCQAENGSNKILKLIALDFNRRIPTKTNVEFCNMLTTVYQELVDRANNFIRNCGDRDLSRCRKFEQTNQKYIINIMNFIKYNYEADEKEFGDMLLAKLKERFPKDVDFNFYMFLSNVELGNFTEAKKYFELPPKDRRIADEYLIRIAEIYIEYMENLANEETFNEAYEKLLCSLREFLKYFHRDTDGWILLYCLYKKSGYLPGMEFARWHYEDHVNDKPHRILENVPLTRMRIYCAYEIPFQSLKAIHFYDTVKLFQSIGAYKFADIIFDEIAAECNDVERHLQKSTLKIFLNELDPQSVPRSFPAASAGPVRAFVELVNGNMAFSRGEKGTASEYYDYVMHMENDGEFDMTPFELGIRRHAVQLTQNGNYEEAVVALSKCCNLNGSCMIASIHMGHLLYKLGRYEEALERLKYSTNYNIHIPDVWAYLALINLKLGNNFNALECWKYAKLNPENVISNEILEELNKINIDDIDLYVDKPL